MTGKEKRTGKPRYKIRYRHRRGYSKEAQGYIGWGEYQLLDGARVIGRYDFEDQAERAMRELEGKSNDR